MRDVAGVAWEGRPVSAGNRPLQPSRLVHNSHLSLLSSPDQLSLLQLPLHLDCASLALVHPLAVYLHSFLDSIHLSPSYYPVRKTVLLGMNGQACCAPRDYALTRFLDLILREFQCSYSTLSLYRAVDNPVVPEDKRSSCLQTRQECL